jgi:hypothetical protein
VAASAAAAPVAASAAAAPVAASAAAASAAATAAATATPAAPAVAAAVTGIKTTANLIDSPISNIPWYIKTGIFVFWLISIIICAILIGTYPDKNRAQEITNSIYVFGFIGLCGFPGILALMFI